MRTGRPTSGLAVIAVLVLVALAAMADTFTNKKTGEKIEGSLLTKSRLGSNEQLVVRTDNGGVRNLPAAEWDVVEEAKNTVCFLQIEVPLETEGARDEILKDIKRAAARRADIVVVELDTPGGVVEYAKQICLSLEAQKFRRVVAYVRAGENQGAFSAGALIAMACDEIYIAEGASIGAAAPFVMTEEGPEFTEKMTSAFSANFRSLAEKHNRPKALAAAMVDPDVELREVTVDGKREFVSGERAEELGRTGATIGKWIIRKGKLLTLTAVEARDLGIADAVANSREELLKALGWPRARVVDLQTTRWVAAWLEYARVFRGLAASFASARGADPARFKYDLAERVVGPTVDDDGYVRRGYNYWVFADGGRLWRLRTDQCVAQIDTCLGLGKTLLDMGRKNSRLGVPENDCVIFLKRLSAWKQELLRNRNRDR